MPLAKKTYRQIANDILTQIVGGEAVDKNVYEKGKITYKLLNTPCSELKEVEGTSKGVRKVFVKDADFRLREDCIEWLGGGEHPDENSSFTAKYMFTRAPGISDLNAGSVVRTIVEAVSREIEYLYLQMERAYLSGFIDTAMGEALDLVTSIVGVSRKPPQPSSGYVTFGRSAEPEVLPVIGEVHLYDGSPNYVLNKPFVKEITKVEGTSEGSPRIFEKDIDYRLFEKSVRWQPDGKKPDETTIFHIDYNVYREVLIPKGTGVATFSTVAEEVRFFNTAEEAFLAPTSQNRWEAEVPVICTVPGKWGNVLAGTITVMPQPVPSVEYVINKADMTNGVEIEADHELRQRAKHALEFAGKATYSSLEAAIRSVEGVRSLLIEDMPEETVGIVKVVVDGGDMDRILHVVDETRAAGVKVEVIRPRIAYVDVGLTLVLEAGISSTQIVREVERLVRSYISSLEIGDDVLFSRIIESALNVGGVWDVKDVKITVHKVGEEVLESERENIEMTGEERAEPRTINVYFEEVE